MKQENEAMNATLCRQDSTAAAAAANVTMTHPSTKKTNAHFTHHRRKVSGFPTCFPCKTGSLSVSIHLITTEQLSDFHLLDRAGSAVTSCSRVPAATVSPCKKIWSHCSYNETNEKH